VTIRYLYVDGENFTKRAAALQEELRAAPDQLAKLSARTVGGGAWTHYDALANVERWCPEPHRDMVKERTRTANGILYTRDEVYWDPVGLYAALAANLAYDQSHVRGAYNRNVVQRAYYFTSASQERIDQHTRDLHAIGFAPHVIQRVKPDGWVRDLAQQGITVVSRPKPVDILIATQVLEDCADNNFDECIFVGGDEDYVPLLEAVRRRGKAVWLVAFERWLAQGGRLRYACDRFLAYDSVLAARPLP
jgi:uncharacterized LabA/DUF88 family protein